LIEEIHARTSLKQPITKQDSYGHAIYHGAARKGINVKKQGELIGRLFTSKLPVLPLA
jgi:hypothetical protein